jgi:hypothetical protein
VTKFVRKKNDVYTKDGRIKPASLGMHREPYYCVSVFRTNRMSPSEQANAEALVCPDNRSAIYGYLHLTPELIKQVAVPPYTLGVLPEESEHKWHADIVGWPKGADEHMRSIRMQMGQQLSRIAPEVTPKSAV